MSIFLKPLIFLSVSFYYTLSQRLLIFTDRKKVIGLLLLTYSGDRKEYALQNREKITTASNMSASLSIRTNTAYYYDKLL